MEIEYKRKALCGIRHSMVLSSFHHRSKEIEYKRKALCGIRHSMVWQMKLQ